MAELWVDPERLASVTPQFESLGDTVNTALQTLQQGIQAEGHCWGGDKPGKQFEANYPQSGTGSIDTCLKSLQQLVDVLQATGNKITGTAAGLRSQDDHNATGITDAGQVEA